MGCASAWDLRSISSFSLKALKRRVSAKVPGTFGVHYQLCWMKCFFLLTDNWTIHDISGYFRFIAVRSGLVAHFAALWILPKTTTITYSARGQTSPDPPAPCDAASTCVSPWALGSLEWAPSPVPIHENLKWKFHEIPTFSWS